MSGPGLNPYYVRKGQFPDSAKPKMKIYYNYAYPEPTMMEYSKAELETELQQFQI